MPSTHERNEQRPFSRYNFLQLVGLTVLAACNRGPVAPTINPDVPAATAAAAESLTFAEANQALDVWRQFQAGGETYVLSSQIGVLTEENNPNKLITLNPLQNGVANTDVDWGVGVGQWTNTGTNEQMTRLIFLRDEGGTIQTYGLLNVIEDTESQRVFAASQVEGGVLADAGIEVVVEKTEGNATIGMRDKTTGEITYLVDPASEANLTPSPTDVPRSVVDQLISVSFEGGPFIGDQAGGIPPAESDVKYDLCADWGEASQCPIPWEDIKKGVPGDIARLEGQPFPDTAYNTGNVYITDDGQGSASLTWFPGDPEDTDYRTNPETRPYRWVGFFSTIDDSGRSYLGAVQQWLNPSGRISYLTYLLYSYPSLREKAETMWRQMAVGWPEVNTGFWTSETCPPDIYTCEIILDEETNALILRWEETGEIPEELENKPLFPLIYDSPDFLPLTP